MEAKWMKQSLSIDTRNFVIKLTYNWLAKQICDVWPKFDFKIKRDKGKNSYDRRAYESVDDRSLSWVTSQKWRENKIKAVKG